MNKYWKTWWKNLDDEEIKDLVKSEDELDNLSDHLYKKIIEMIEKPENLITRKKESKEKFYHNKLILKFSIVFASIVLLFLSTLVFIKFKDVINQNSLIAMNVKGDVLLINDKKDQLINLKNNKKIKTTESVRTGNKSSAALVLGGTHIITINEKAEVKFTEVYKHKSTEKTHLKIKQGFVLFSLGKLNADSSFIVETDELFVNVKGTVFSVNSRSGAWTKVDINFGIVGIIPKIKINEIETIREIDPLFAGQIEDIINKDILFGKGETVLVTKEKIKEIEKNISLILLPTVKVLNENLKNKYDRSYYVEQLKAEMFKFKKEINGSLQNDQKSSNIKNNDKGFDINIQSPVYKYYEATPVLDYSLKNGYIKEILLNNRKININNNNYIKELTNGFNTLSIKAVNNTGKEQIKSIEFFLNKSTLLDSDFTGITNYGWNNVEGIIFSKENRVNSYGIGKIQNNHLVFKGPVKQDDTYCYFYKNYGSLKYDNVILKIDLLNYKPIAGKRTEFNFGFLFTGEQDGVYIYSELDMVVETDIDGLNLFYLKEFQFSPVINNLIITDKINLNLDEIKSLILYREKTDIYGILINKNDYIIKKLVVKNYKSKFLKSVYDYNSVRIYASFGKTKKEESLIELNNYYLFKQ